MSSNDKKVENVVKKIEETVSLDDLISLNADDSRFAGLSDAICTYDEGYIRQEVFSCLTCYEKTNQIAGVCFACSNNCHDGHELVELYTRRQFTCDCGNGKFAEKCKLQPEKNAANKYNKYCDNFFNKWCICKKPYPPEENTPEFDAEMLQCVSCEDWFHSIHLDQTPTDDVEEMICKQCVTRLPFLLAYDNYPKEDRPNEGCFIANRKEMTTQEPRTLFFVKSKEFRDGLCKCAECESLYSSLECEFLTDFEESAVKYNQDRDEQAVEEDKRDAATEISSIVKNSMGADAAVYVKNEVDILKTIAKDELQNVTVVTERDVKRIFDRVLEIRAKRPRLEDYRDYDV
uniref:UBR-type domain-containing protein n=1 Tax=Panagrolaimus sp. PS1159 TaxID=55785 RepID=A0AC35GI54_9BILA